MFDLFIHHFVLISNDVQHPQFPVVVQHRSHFTHFTVQFSSDIKQKASSLFVISIVISIDINVSKAQVNGSKQCTFDEIGHPQNSKMPQLRKMISARYVRIRNNITRIAHISIGPEKSEITRCISRHRNARITVAIVEPDPF